MIRRAFAATALVIAATAVGCADDDTLRFEDAAGPRDTRPAEATEPPDADGSAPTGSRGGSKEQPSGADDPADTGGDEATLDEGDGNDDPFDDGSDGGHGQGSFSPDGGGGAPGQAINDRGTVGSAGRALLRSDIDAAAVEIDATPGASLTDEARVALGSNLSTHGGKAVSFAAGSDLPEQDVYTSDQLRSLMNAHRDTWSTADRAGVYVMVLSGRHENETVVGVSFHATAFAIFSDQLGGGLLGLNYASYEKAVAVHELGHLFGLVNITGHGAFHEDPDHERHSVNEGSVMYWAVESTVVGDVFEGGPPTTFDADDVQEMAAIRAA